MWHESCRTPDTRFDEIYNRLGHSPAPEKVRTQGHLTGDDAQENRVRRMAESQRLTLTGHVAADEPDCGYNWGISRESPCSLRRTARLHRWG